MISIRHEKELKTIYIIKELREAKIKLKLLLMFTHNKKDHVAVN